MVSSNHFTPLWVTIFLSQFAVSRKSEIDLAPRALESEIEKMRRLLESPERRLRRA
jgi:hypothetical protein